MRGAGYWDPGKKYYRGRFYALVISILEQVLCHDAINRSGVGKIVVKTLKRNPDIGKQY